jgi:hypothetical protein
MTQTVHQTDVIGTPRRPERNSSGVSFLLCHSQEDDVLALPKIAPFDRCHTKLGPDQILRIFALRFPTDGSDSLDVPSIAKRFGVTGKTIGEILKKYRQDCRPTKGAAQ